MRSRQIRADPVTQVVGAGRPGTCPRTWSLMRPRRGAPRQRS